MKRFKYNDFGKVGSKNDASIKYPYSQWDLKPHVQSQGGVYPIYDLYAVSNHMGSLGGGHYTALALNRFDDLWYEGINLSTGKQGIFPCRYVADIMSQDISSSKFSSFIFKYRVRNNDEKS